MIILAWIVQIIITILSSISIFVFFVLPSIDPAKTPDNLSLILLVTFIFAVAELCKIPLVSVIYYSKKNIRQAIFLLILLMICISEFETFLQIIEISFGERNIRSIIVVLIAILASPVISLIGYRLKNKNK